MKVLKNGRSDLFHMNGEALKNLITAAGYTCKSLSEKMEFNGNYLSKCIKKNMIGRVAVQKLMEYNIKPAMYQVENFDILKKKIERMKEAREAEEIRINHDGSNSLKDISKNPCKRCALRDKETNGPSDCASCRCCKANPNVAHPLNRNSGRYPVYEEKSPAEQAIEEPGVIKLEFTIDIVKLKAIVKQAVKEAYEEL